MAISEAILASIRNIFEDYGVEIVNFSINHIQIPESDTRALEDIIKKKRILEMQDKSFKSEDEARQEAYKLHADTVVKLAEIEAKKDKPQKTLNINISGEKYCSKCGKKIASNSMYCPNCGEKQ